MGYANRRPRPANGNFNSRVLKPAKKKSYWFVWVGALLLSASGTTVFCLLKGKEPVQEAEPVQDVKPVQGTEQKERTYIPYGSLRIGEYFNLADKEFCESQDIKADTVKVKFDERRGANVYYYEEIRERHESAYAIGSRNLMPSDRWKSWFFESKAVYEVSNKVVMKEEESTWAEEPWARAQPNSRVEVLKSLDIFFIKKVFGAKVLATTKNIKYRGSSISQLETSVKSAVSSAMKSPGSLVLMLMKVSGKYSDYYVKWYFLRGGEVYTILTHESDQCPEIDAPDVDWWDTDISEVSF